MSLPEAFEACLPVIRCFEELRVDYLVGGSVASSYYGTPRSTQDVDLVADLRIAHAIPLVEALKNAYYVDLDRILDSVRRKRSFNVIYLATMFKVDVFVLKEDDPLAKEELRRRQRIEVADEIYLDIASAEDTILQKLIWYQQAGGVSDRQWNDLLGVLKVQSQRLDQDYLYRWAGHKGIDALLEKALSEALS